MYRDRAVMLADDEDPDSLCSGPPLKPLSPEKDVKVMLYRQQDEKTLQQTSSQRSASLGFKTDPELVWEDWNLQGELTKILVLKNIHSKQKMIHVRPPATEVFTVLTQGIIFISPGTTFSVPIRFRPLQLTEYEDSIDFQCKGGSFRVCLRATVPHHALEVPESLLLPKCAVEHSTNASFLLRNLSKLETFFQWECKPPFQLHPEKGLLSPRQNCCITVVFQPQAALVHREHAHCWFGEENNEAKRSCTVLLEGEAKMPCLQLRIPGVEKQCDPVLSFGSVAVGKSSQKSIEIFNPTPVTTSFTLSLLTDWVPLTGLEFTCDMTDGEVVPGGSKWANVIFTPTVVDSSSIQYLSLKCRGAVIETLLKLSGGCIGPKISLSSPVLDFGCVEEGEERVHQMELINSSPAEAVYQWDLDYNAHSVFNIHPACGIVRPHSQTSLKAVYRPTQPAAHHRRVPCLILRMEPVFLTLLGTCNSKSTQPSEKLQRPESTEQKSAMEEYYLSCLGCSGPLALTTPTSPAVTVEPTNLMFNIRMSSPVCASWSSSQTVSVTNHTKLELCLVWTTASDSPFSIFPPSCKLMPLKCTSFIVTYDPKQPNILHAVQLECFAYHQGTHCDEKQSLYPPYCINVRVIGCLFQRVKEPIIPSCSLEPSRVVFVPFNVRSYQTALLKNCGDCPLTFCLDHNMYGTLAETVAVAPRCGLIYPGGHQILTLWSNPTEDSPGQEFSIHLQLNGVENAMVLTVAILMQKPSMSLEADGSLYFQPTVVGSSTQRRHCIRNLSHLPLRFQWSIADPDQGFIIVQPNHGELHPNDKSVQMWSFSPLEEKEYTFAPKLTFWPTHTPGCNNSELILNVTGVGSKGFILAEKAFLDIGEIVAGGYRSAELSLVNQSPCSVSFCLSVTETVLDKNFAAGPKTMPNAIQLEFEKGTIASHSKLPVQLTVKPRRQARYLWTISYQILSTTGCVLSPLQAVCEVQAQALFPSLQVVDVCGGGSLGNVSKLHLWKLFSLDSLNGLLLSPPSPAELTQRPPSRHSFDNTALELKFNAAPLNSETSTVFLMLYNPGSLSVDWAFLFPDDQHIKSGFRADTGIVNVAESKAQAKHLFNIFPCSGTLLPGQQGAVHFRYRHDFVGTDQLSVVFQLSHGRELLLILEGVTVERDGLCVVCPPRQHVFNPVFIGDCNPPRQILELYNGCAVPFHYKVDLAVLSQLQKDNFNHQILRCLNPEGEVLPDRRVMLEWIFSPIEAKMYQIEIPIQIKNRDSILVRLEGCGITTPVLGSKTPFRGTNRSYEQCVQSRPFPEQAASLSQDSICLGDIPVRSQYSRLICLTNTSSTDTIYYKWVTDDQQVVLINPEDGFLTPGETAISDLTFTASDHPKCYQLDVICQITQETLLTPYLQALQRWEEVGHQHDFSAADKKLSLNSTEWKAEATKITHPTLKKYKILPPITAAAVSDPVVPVCAKRAQRRAQRAAALLMRPEPPQAALIHLEVTARSHEHLECFKHFPEQFNKLHGTFRSLNFQQCGASVSDTSLPKILPQLTNGPDRNMLMELLTSLFWHILTGPAIMQQLTTFNFSPRQPRDQDMSSQPTTQRLTVQGGRISGQPQQHSMLDKKGTAELSGRELQPQNMLHADTPPDMCEDVLLKTLHNLVVETVRMEFDLTAPPHASHRGQQKPQ
ncbi:cilia- and flagella-associated protein 65 isoform X2 [Takifugu flavidus]|uniref:cilia- and flagella-associated protein 65 isoform X2 n=1 Tax=Takifugu flavidus TaxID=433684 RepID=UPI0025443DC2|nr:cilia- and flagella-associated protein 65 isoform X2 [Takifugu flavidus]